MTKAFYGDLLQAIIDQDEERAKELLAKLSSDQLQDVALAGRILDSLAEEVFLEKNDV